MTTKPSSLACLPCQALPHHAKSVSLCGGSRVAKPSPYCATPLFLSHGAAGCSGRVRPEPIGFALKEAIRWSLQDVNKAPAPEPSASMDEAPKPAPVEETEPATKETKSKNPRPLLSPLKSALWYR